MNTDKLWIEIEKFKKFANKTTKDMPDTNSQIWQTAHNMAQELLNIERQAKNKEALFNK